MSQSANLRFRGLLPRAEDNRSVKAVLTLAGFHPSLHGIAIILEDSKTVSSMSRRSAPRRSRIRNKVLFRLHGQRSIQCRRTRIVLHDSYIKIAPLQRVLKCFRLSMSSLLHSVHSGASPKDPKRHSADVSRFASVKSWFRDCFLHFH